MAEGLRIKEFIERVGIKSQEDLADQLGVTPQTVSKWANGKQFPPHETEEKMLKMGMTVEELFGFPYPSSANAAREDFDRKAGFFMQKLFEKIDKL